jgi:NAD(P)H-binding
LIRNPQQAEALRSQGLTVVCGDACDPESVYQACQLAGPDAGNLGLKRMLLVAYIGCGDNLPTLSPAARAAFGQAVREKSLAESWLQTSGLIYTLVRPGGWINPRQEKPSVCKLKPMAWSPARMLQYT